MTKNIMAATGFHACPTRHRLPGKQGQTLHSQRKHDDTMQLKRLFFPHEPRYLPGHRWINISLRTLHLIGVSGLGAGFLYAAADEQWQMYWDITLISGIAMSLLFIYSNGIFLIQLRGQAILLKLALLGMMPVLTHLQLPLFLAVIVISGVIAHAPASVRYYSLWHGRRVEGLD